MKVDRDPPFPIGVQGEMPRDTLIYTVTNVQEWGARNGATVEKR